MLDLIWADEYGRERGFVPKASGDFTIGRLNSFSLKVPKGLGIAQDCLVMIDGTEYGGYVDGVEEDTSADFVTVSGPTWHGLLASGLIVPDPGQTHYTASGDCNAVLQSVIERLGLGERMEASASPSGFEVSGWRFSRISTEMDAYTGVRAMLRSAGAKLGIRYSSERRKAVLSAVPRGDYTSDGLDGDRARFVVKRTRPVNHLHCLGAGEGAGRIAIDLYADAGGNVSKRQAIFGMRHREEAFENSASSAEDLEAEGAKYLKELQAAMFTCGFAGADDGRYDIDDIVGGTTADGSVSVVTAIAEKVATVSSRGITYETKTELEV